MRISIYFTSLLFWLIQDFVNCVTMKTPSHILTVAMGDSLTLNCTYNCSSGFVRGCWSRASDNSHCLGSTSKVSSKRGLCSVSLLLPNVSTEDLRQTFTCYTRDTGDPNLSQNTERIVQLQLEDQTSDRQEEWTVTTNTVTTNASLPAKPNDSNGGILAAMKLFAIVSVSVTILLAALATYLCVKRNRQGWNEKGESAESRSGSPLPLSVMGSTQNERVTLRIPTPDSESDTEVPYADIMITIRGVSTPELTQVGYLTPGNLTEFREGPRPHLQASRSADRLHLLVPREVSRKMSTNSEYAVIMYA